MGLIAKGFMDEGRLVPDDIITTIVVDELKKYEQDSWLLDGKFRRVLVTSDTVTGRLGWM